MTFSEAFAIPPPNNERYKVYCGKWSEYGNEHYMPKCFDIMFLKTLDKKQLIELINNDNYQDIWVFDNVRKTHYTVKTGSLIHKNYIK